ncbi:MAG: hypothetical protein DME55_01610 [Verrucomicrobia bacterium]|nr:MAG: hypothetical protein DME55_01610 [Verrucomicrobiota bacterium]
MFEPRKCSSHYGVCVTHSA